MQEPTKVEFLVHSGNFLDNDTIKGQEGSATFFGEQWFPSSESFRMEPGKGYLLNTANPGQLTFDSVENLPVDEDPEDPEDPGY